MSEPIDHLFGDFVADSDINWDAFHASLERGVSGSSHGAEQGIEVTNPETQTADLPDIGTVADESIAQHIATNHMSSQNAAVSPYFDIYDGNIDTAIAEMIANGTLENFTPIDFNFTNWMALDNAVPDSHPVKKTSCGNAQVICTGRAPGDVQVKQSKFGYVDRGTDAYPLKQRKAAYSDRGTDAFQTGESPVRSVACGAHALQAKRNHSALPVDSTSAKPRANPPVRLELKTHGLTSDDSVSSHPQDMDKWLAQALVPRHVVPKSLQNHTKTGQTDQFSRILPADAFQHYVPVSALLRKQRKYDAFNDALAPPPGEVIDFPCTYKHPLHHVLRSKEGMKKVTKRSCTCNNVRKIPRELNSFFLYRKDFVRCNPELSMPAASRRAKLTWTRLSEDIKARYKAKADMNKIKQLQDYPGYKYTTHQPEKIRFGFRWCTCGAYDENMEALDLHLQAETGPVEVLSDTALLAYVEAHTRPELSPEDDAQRGPSTKRARLA